MPERTPLKRLPNKGDGVKVLHVCTQKENIAKMNLILIGNGHPEDGLAFKVIQMSKDVADIKTRLSTVNEINTELEIQRRVKAELERKGIATDEKEHKRKTINWQRIATITAMLAFMVMAFFQVLGYFNGKETKTTVQAVDQRVEQLGTPVLVDSTGHIMDGRGFKFGMWPKDFIKKDSVK